MSGVAVPGFVPPVFASPYNFSVDVTSGVYYDETQLAGLEEVLSREGLQNLAELVHLVRAGQGVRPQDFQGVVASVARRSEK